MGGCLIRTLLFQNRLLGLYFALLRRPPSSLIKDSETATWLELKKGRLQKKSAEISLKFNCWDISSKSTFSRNMSLFLHGGWVVNFPTPSHFFICHPWGWWVGVKGNLMNVTKGSHKKKTDYLVTLIKFPLTPTHHPPRMTYEKMTRWWKVYHTPTVWEVMTYSWKKWFSKRYFSN